MTTKFLGILRPGQETLNPIRRGYRDVDWDTRWQVLLRRRLQVLRETNDFRLTVELRGGQILNAEYILDTSVYVSHINKY